MVLCTVQTCTHHTSTCISPHAHIYMGFPMICPRYEWPGFDMRHLPSNVAPGDSSSPILPPVAHPELSHAAQHLLQCFLLRLPPHDAQTNGIGQSLPHYGPHHPSSPPIPFLSPHAFELGVVLLQMSAPQQKERAAVTRVLPLSFFHGISLRWAQRDASREA